MTYRCSPKENGTETIKQEHLIKRLVVAPGAVKGKHIIHSAMMTKEDITAV